MDAAVSHIWQSTLVAFVAALVALSFGRYRAAVRYAVWFSASMKFFVPFAALAALVPQAVEISDPRIAMVTTTVFSGSSLVTPANQYSTMAVTVIWLCGTLALAAMWLSQWRRAMTIAQGGFAVSSGAVHDALREAERALGCRRPTPLVFVEQNIEPCVIGIARPILIWPRTLLGLDDRSVETIVTHEVAHVLRRDNLSAALHMAVTTVFWFHPMVWWIGARLGDERERACDETVLALGGSPAVYAASILKTCELCLTSSVPCVAGVAGGGLKKRIAKILSGDRAVPLTKWSCGALAVITALVVIAPLTAGQTLAVRPVQAPPEEVEKLQPGMEPPRVLKEVKPQYTPRAMQEKIEGEVLMECVVRTSGKPTDIKIVKSLDRDLDGAAVAALEQFVFEPGKRRGKPVDVRVDITMRFTLKK